MYTVNNQALMLKSLDYTVGNKYHINKTDMMYFGNYNNLHLLFGDVIFQSSLLYVNPKFYFNHILKFRFQRTGKIPTRSELEFIADQIEKFDLQILNESQLTLVSQSFFHIDNIYYYPNSSRSKITNLNCQVFLLTVHRMDSTCYV